MRIQNFENEILTRGVGDYTGLQELVFLLGSMDPPISPTEFKDLCIEAIRNLASTGKIELGELMKPGEFQRWDLDIDSALSKIDEEWLTMTEGYFDTVWISNTEVGNSIGRAYTRREN